MKTYDKIMESSYRLFLEKGFHEVSWADISEEAEISPGTLYYYFKTRRADSGGSRYLCS